MAAVQVRQTHLSLPAEVSDPSDSEDEDPGCDSEPASEDSDEPLPMTKHRCRSSSEFALGRTEHKGNSREKEIKREAPTGMFFLWSVPTILATLQDKVYQIPFRRIRGHQFGRKWFRRVGRPSLRIQPLSNTNERVFRMYSSPGRRSPTPERA